MKTKMLSKTVSITDIKGSIKKIKNSDNSFITSFGEVYIEYKPKRYYKKKTFHNFGYECCGIKYNGKIVNKRIHRLVAEAFIPNPKKLKIVGHKNNIKDDNRVDNLYWTTISENTQKAYNDNLCNNAKGYNDSQSIAIYCCDKDWNIIKDYGSISDCAKELKISKSTINRQVIKAMNMNFGSPKGNFRFCRQCDYKKVKNIKTTQKQTISVYAYNLRTKQITKYSSLKDCESILKISTPTIRKYMRGYQNIKKNRCGYIFSYNNDFLGL